ncbi:plant invertase/pectin methylesterase inhibitor, partial [Striga asiatica]
KIREYNSIGGFEKECISTMQSATPHQKADANGLAFFTLKFVEEEDQAVNLTADIKKVTLSDVSPLLQSALSDCLDQYNPLDDLIEDAINAVLGNAYVDAKKFIEAAMSDIDVCDSQLKASNVEEKAENKNGDEVQLSKNLNTILSSKTYYRPPQTLSNLKQTKEAWRKHSRARNPIIPEEKRRHSEIRGVRLIDQMKPGPFHPSSRVRPGSRVVELRVVRGVEREIPNPLAPPGRLNRPIHKRLHVNRPRVFLPWSAEVCLDSAIAGRQVFGCPDCTILDRDARVLVGVGSALGSNCVELPGHWEARPEAAALKNDGRVAEDEVDRAVDMAVAVELSEGVDVQCVLVSLEAAIVEDREIGPVSEGNCLVLGGARRVSDGDVGRDEVGGYHGCRNGTE